MGSNGFRPPNFGTGNFFLEYDACFCRSGGVFEVRPKPYHGHLPCERRVVTERDHQPSVKGVCLMLRKSFQRVPLLASVLTICLLGGLVGWFFGDWYGTTVIRPPHKVIWKNHAGSQFFCTMRSQKSKNVVPNLLKPGEDFAIPEAVGPCEVWSMSSGRKVGEIPIESHFAFDGAGYWDVSFDGKYFAEVHGPLVRVWRTADCQLHQEIGRKAESESCVIAFAPHDQRLAVLTGTKPRSKSGQIWDLDAQRAMCQLPLVDEARGELHGIHFSPAGRFVHYGSAIWDATTGQPLGEWRHGSGWAYSYFNLSADDQWLLHTTNNSHPSRGYHATELWKTTPLERVSQVKDMDPFVYSHNGRVCTVENGANGELRVVSNPLAVPEKDHSRYIDIDLSPISIPLTKNSTYCRPLNARYATAFWPDAIPFDRKPFSWIPTNWRPALHRLLIVDLTEQRIVWSRVVWGTSGSHFLSSDQQHVLVPYATEHPVFCIYPISNRTRWIWAVMGGSIPLFLRLLRRRAGQKRFDPSAAVACLIAIMAIYS